MKKRNLVLALLGVIGMSDLLAAGEQEKPAYAPALEWVMAYSHGMTPPEMIGPTAEGLRFNLQVTEGPTQGPNMAGRILPGGTARIVVRTDGVCTFEAHATGKTEEGALYMIEADGSCDAGPDGYKQFVDGKAPAIIKLWVVSRISTAHPKYEWLNRRQFVQFGQADMKSGVVSYDVYAMR